MVHTLLPAFLFFLLASFLIIEGASRFDRKNYDWLCSIALSRTSYAIAIVSLIGVMLVEVSFYLHYSDLVLFDAEAGSMVAAWLWSTGAPLYPDGASDKAYGLLYGPLTFLLYGLPFELGARSMLPARAIAATLFVGALGMTAAIALRQRGSNLARLAVLLLALGLIAMFGRSVYTARGDVALFFLLSLSVLALKTRWRLPVAAVSLGLAVNFKITAVLYFLPIAAYVIGDWIESSPARRREMHPPLDLLLAGSAFVAVVFLPFASNGVTWQQYANEVLAAGQHEIEVERMVKVSFSVLLFALLPVALVRRQFPDENKAMLFAGYGLFCSGVVAAILGGKVGSGAYHLLPLLPFLVFYLAEKTSGDHPFQIPARKFAAIIGGAQLGMTAYFFGMFVLGTNYVVFAASPDKRGVTQEAVREAILLVDKYRPNGVAMVPGALPSRRSNVVINGLFVGSDFLATDIAFWDIHAAKKAAPANLVKRVSDCEVPFLIAPKGDQPFAGDSLYYSGVPAAIELRDAVAATYQKEADADYFSVWSCNKTGMQGGKR